MTAKFATLKRQARLVSEQRGHALSKFSSVPQWAQEMGAKSEATCDTCYAWVSVTTRPLPNDIGMGGSALAINCVGSK